MFRHVIVGVDGRPTGRDAISLGRQLLDPAGRLTLVHVHVGEFHPSRRSELAFDAVERDESDRLLETERDEVGVEADLISVAAPSVGRGLHHSAEAHGADLIVVGSCHRGFAGRVLLGDDTREALNAAPCAVAVAPLGYAKASPALTTIGVGYDGSPESDVALRVARELADRRQARVHVLEVVGVPTAPYTALAPIDWGMTIEGIMEDARRRVAALGDVEPEVAIGLAGEELAAFGARVGLLVVGSRNYGPLRRLILGSTSQYLARHARGPVLVLPRSGSPAIPSPSAPAPADTAVGAAG